ncbi:MAG: tetratricopeptide repeat protein, partial [Vicinamibacteria bacterium]
AQTNAGGARAAEATQRARLVAVGDDPDLLNLLASLRSRTGARDEAVDLMKRAVEQRPEDPDLWFNWGVACAGARMPGAARQCIERVVVLAPDHAGARDWLERAGAASR